MVGTKHTNLIDGVSIANSMQQGHHAARIGNGLLPPHDRLLGALAPILLDETVLGHALALVYIADGEDEQQGVGRFGDHLEEIDVVEGVDIVHGQLVGDAELVDEVGHELWVGL